MEKLVKSITTKENLVFKKLSGFRKKVVLVKGNGTKEKRSKDFAHLPAPFDQVYVDPDGLKEEIPRIITVSKNPEINTIICYSNKDMKWVPVSKPDRRHIYLDFVGNYYFKDSEEAKIYTLQKNEIEAKRRSYYDPRIVDDYLDENNILRFRVLKNKFNYADRVVQTYDNIQKDASTQTDPPKVATFSDNVTQFSIYTIYKEDAASKMINQRKALSFPKPVAIKLSERKYKTPLALAQEQKLQEAIRMSYSAKVIERMMSQNTFDDIFVDFKYYDDVADGYRREGSLLPLWKFPNTLTKHLTITGISWNKTYTDLFAVSTGSYNFFKKSQGSIVCYSLKNPSYPELIVETKSGCMSLDFHPKLHYLIAAGFYDGNVVVYDLRLVKKSGSTSCFKAKTKHYDPVWQVQWQPATPEGYENFNSVSSDGKIINWELRKHFLVSCELNRLSVPEIDPDSKVPGTYKYVPQCGTCLDFNTQQQDLFIVGTEEGKVLELSSLHKDQLLTVFDAHAQSIYSIKWNYFFKRVFITCSADFTVKIWDHRYKNPLLTYELPAPVCDVQWAPYSSTVFAALTVDGCVHVYDIYLDLASPLCIQNVVIKKKRKLTRVCFSPFSPVILIGDDKGTLASFKLSPNLRSIRENSITPISILNKDTFEEDKIRTILSREADINPELVETNRKDYKFERPKIKRQTNKDEDDQPEEKSSNKKGK